MTFKEEPEAPNIQHYANTMPDELPYAAEAQMNISYDELNVNLFADGFPRTICANLQNRFYAGNIRRRWQLKGMPRLKLNLLMPGD